MKRNKQKRRTRRGLQALTLCISTAMVLVLLGMVVLSVLSARNVSTYFRENLEVTVTLEDDMSPNEAQQFCKRLEKMPSVKSLVYVSKEQALKEGIRMLGVDPTEFTEGENPFTSMVRLTMRAEYANNDSLAAVASRLKAYPKVGEVHYQKKLIDALNRHLAKLSAFLLILALLLTCVSFTLINNTVRLGIYARRFSIHTMKLVGASWSFIRKPFVKQALTIGIVAAVLACVILEALVYAWYVRQPGITVAITWSVMAITFAVMFFCGIAITTVCAHISVNEFLRMKAGELYKI